MKVTDQLLRDHQVILRGLDILKSAAASWRHDPLGKEADFRALLDFLKTFADRCHHSKEEKVLFPKLMQVGAPVNDGPLGLVVYEHEHNQGRQLLRNMEQALEAGHLGDFVFYAGRYTQLLEEHIAKEDNLLFAAEEHLTPEDDDELSRRFDEIEHEMGEETHERLHRVLNALASRYLSEPRKAS